MIPQTFGTMLLARLPLTPALLWTLAALALGLLVWLWLRVKGWGAAAGWTALAFAGQACALQLLNVGPSIRLQLFWGWSDLLRSWRITFLGGVALQALIVAWGLWRAYLRDAEFRRQARSFVSWPQAVALFVILAYASITIAPEVARAFVYGGFRSQAILHATKIALGLTILFCGTGSLLLAAYHFPREIWARLAECWNKRNRKRLPWVAVAWVVVVSSFLAWYPLAGMPHVPDEVGYIFQGKYFSTGVIYLPPPADSRGIDAEFQLVENGKWFGSPPAGWPMVLSLGYRLGLPWLINPLLGGIALLLSHALIRRIYGENIADGVTLLLAVSPWLLFLSASLMPHPFTLVFSLLGMLGVSHAREGGGFGWGLVAGLGIGALLHGRPLEAVTIAVIGGVWWLSKGWKNLRISAIAGTLLGGLLLTGLFLAYNKALTGNPTLLPITRYTDIKVYPGANRLGFGKDVGNFGWTGLDALPGHGPIDVFMNTNQNVYLVDFETFGWACGSLLFVFLLLVWGRWRADALMWGWAFALWAAMSLYWFSGGPDFGARYWYQLILPCVVLTVRGAQEAAARLRSSSDISAAPSRVWAFVFLATLLGAVNLVPWRSFDKYHNYRGIRPDVRALQRHYNFGRSLVLVRGKDWPDYASAFVFNPPRFDGSYDGPIYAREISPEVTGKLRSFYSDRTVWVIAGPSVTGKDFAVVAGPIAPGVPLTQAEPAPGAAPSPAQASEKKP